jgi:DNA polymerase III subunit beta
MRWLLEKTAFAMAQQDVRHYLNGLLLEFRDGQVRAVATDGHRLALAEFPADISGEMRSVIVPRKGVLELTRILEDIDEPLNVTLGQGFLRVDRERVVMTTKLIDGRFPDYEAVIPLTSEQPLQADRGELTHALQRAAILSNEKYRGVRLEMLPDTVAHRGPQPAAGRSDRGDRGRAQFDKLKVGFNVNYLLDALGAMEGEEGRHLPERCQQLLPGDRYRFRGGASGGHAAQALIPVGQRWIRWFAVADRCRGDWLCDRLTDATSETSSRSS